MLEGSGHWRALEGSEIRLERDKPCGRCEVKPQELWHQSGAARFKFATDESFDRFLRERCGFGLPSLEKETTTAAAAR